MLKCTLTDIGTMPSQIEQHMPMLFHDNKTNKQKLASSRTYEERQVVAAGVGGKEDVGTEESDI